MYTILKILSRFTLKAYFRRIKIEGLENIGEGPYIFISNHPSAFMDPVVVATSIKPTIYFLAAGEYMGKGLTYWFMNRFLNMIPVYRPETMPGKTHKNTAIFDKCIAHLKRGRSILVFPEGASNTEKRVHPLKTGVARIVRATEVACEFKANVRILPIGLNYSDPHKFRSDLFVKIGQPIQASDFFTSNEDGEVDEVKKLTEHMETALIETVIHMQELEFEELLDQVNKTYSRDLKSELGVEFSEQDREFELNKLMVDAFEYFKSNEPTQYETMRSEIETYSKQLSEHHITDRELRQVDKKMNFMQGFFLFWGFPFFIIGWIGNVIPHQLTTALQKKINVKGSFKGSITLASGMLIFLLWYVTLTLLLWFLTPLHFLALLAPIVLYITGVHTMVYTSISGFLLRRRKLRKRLEQESELKSTLISQRQALMDKFQQFRSHYDTRPVS